MSTVLLPPSPNWCAAAPKVNRTVQSQFQLDRITTLQLSSTRQRPSLFGMGCAMHKLS